MLHSGSRNIGKELADFHIGQAQKLPHNQGLVDRDLAVFIADTPQMAAYRNDLFWAQEYAKYNRAIMMALFQDVVRKEFKKAKVDVRAGHLLPPQLCGGGAVRRHGPAGHPEGRDPGGLRASTAIIPGSMGTGSYIVKGLGNADVVQLRLARRRPADEPERREAAVLHAGSGGPDAGRGVP